MKPTSPCQISIGPHDHLVEHTIDYLQRHLCARRQQKPADICLCHTCQQIEAKQHAAVTWLAPSNDYILDDLEPLFAAIRFSLQPGELHFFVITHANQLSPTCANKLLKALEEPPTGYFFHLLTGDELALLPTLRSRSTVLYRANVPTEAQSPLLPFFLDQTRWHQPIEFEQALKQVAPTTQQARAILWHVASHWQQQNTLPAEKKALLERVQRTMPGQGGGPYALKWLYLHLGL